MKLIKLTDVFRVGSSKRVLKADWKESGVPFYRGREITRLSKTGFADNELFISESHFSELSARHGVPIAGDIMVTAIGTIGNTYIVNESDRFYFKDASVLWLHKKAEVESRFIDYWLKSDFFFEQLDKGNGATVDTLTIEKLSSVELLLPSPEVQREIVEKLDNAFAEVDSLHNNLGLFDCMAEQLLNSILGASCTTSKDKSDSSKTVEAQELALKSQPLGEVFTLEYGKALDKAFREADGAFQAYGANGPISSASKYLIEGPCVIVGRKGSAGEITYVEDNVWPLDVTYYVKHNSEETDLRYLFYTLKSLNIKQFVRGVKPGLNRNDVYELPIQVPSLQMQREIAAKLDNAFLEIESLRFQLRKQKDDAIALRKSLLSNAFSELEEVS